MDEIDVIEKKGIVTSAEVSEMIDKNIRNIIKQLTKLVQIGEIRAIAFHRGKLYLKNELYDNLSEVSRK